MRSVGGSRLLIGLGSVLFAGLLASCSPGYVARGAYEQGRIIFNRRDIKDVLKDSETPEEEREKLALVLEARRFAERIGLTPGASYTTYSDIGQDTLSWVVVGARKDSFALYTWWFPVVGRVPYKGFFDQEDAQAQAKELQAEGFETWTRGTDAFSTLGWFSDPVLSTTLRNPPTRIANTVIHESVHATIWIPGGVPFNESLANFVAITANEQLFSERLAACKSKPEQDCSLAESMLRAARNDAAVQYDLSAGVQGLYEALDALYKDAALSSEEKIARREAVFSKHVTPLRTKYPQLQALRQVNNAEIMQLKIYLTDLALFRELYRRSAGDWSEFFRRIAEIKSRQEEDGTKDPFALLQKQLGE